MLFFETDFTDKELERFLKENPVDILSDKVLTMKMINLMKDIAAHTLNSVDDLVRIDRVSFEDKYPQEWE